MSSIVRIRHTRPLISIDSGGEQQYTPQEAQLRMLDEVATYVKGGWRLTARDGALLLLRGGETIRYEVADIWPQEAPHV